MTRAPYSIDVDVAGLSWSVDVDPADPTPPAPTLGPVAPLTIRESLPDGPVPSQPEPPVATFGLAAADAADLAGVVKGAECHLTYTATGNPDPITFDGNVSDVVLAPAHIVDPDDPAGKRLVYGVLAQVIAVGYLAQLNEEPVTYDEPATHPGGSVNGGERLANLFAATPWSIPYSPGGVDFLYEDRRVAANQDGASLGPLLEALLSTLPAYEFAEDPGGTDVGALVGRLIVEPNLAPDRTLGDLADRTRAWQLRVAAGPDPVAPATFGLTAAGYGLTFDQAHDQRIAAGVVDRSIAYVQRKGTNVTKVIVRYKDGDKDRSTSRNNGVKPTSSHTLETDLVDVASANPSTPTIAADLATIYLPAPNETAWGVDSIQWKLYADAPGRRPPPLGQLVTVAPLRISQNPNGREWVTGLLAAWQLTVAGGRPTVELTLRTGAAAGLPADALTIDELPAGVTIDQLNPTHTIDDYALLRGS